MTAEQLLEKQNQTGFLRSLNIFHDLPTVADIIETCFEGLLDVDGLAAIDDIRRRGKDTGFLAWAPRVIDSVSLPLSGFVWEADGKLVGNVSLIPYPRSGEKYYLIANVATLPAYRRQGIAKELTNAAIQKALSQNASSIWLQVRADNPGAIELYKGLGFVSKYTNTTWYLPPEYKLIGTVNDSVTICRTTSLDWPILAPQYEKIYPPELEWYYGYKIGNFKPGFMNDVKRFFRDEKVVQNSAFISGKLVGGIAVRNMMGQPESIFITPPAEGGTAVLVSLLQSLVTLVDHHKKQVLEIPPGEYDDAIFNTGFVKRRTLLWMKYAPGS